jgi:hypothetical protein
MWWILRPFFPQKSFVCVKIKLTRKALGGGGDIPKNVGSDLASYAHYYFGSAAPHHGALPDTQFYATHEA